MPDILSAVTTNAEINERTNVNFIPGTFNIYTTIIDKDQGDVDGLLVKTRGNIILMPQPCDSQNDPLNWNITRKMKNFFILAFITGFTAATSNDAGATQDSLNAKYGITYDSMNVGAGVLFLGIGWGTFFLAPCASLYGRKVAYFICIILGLGGAIWFAMARRTTDTIFSQLFVGISESCAEAQVQLSLSDLFFQHQLGSVLTVYILATSVGTFLGPMIAGFIVQYTGTFRYVGWIAAIISGALLVVILFVMQETVFDRSKFLTPPGPLIESDQSDLDKLDPSLEKTSEPVDTGKDDPKKSYWTLIQFITPAPNLKGTGFKQYMSQLRSLFKVFLYPPVIFSGLVWGIQDALLTFYLTVEDDEYYDPPYNYSNTGVALMNVPTLIGAIIGCIFAGILSDYFSIWMAKRNNGVQEAEYRLWFLFAPAVISPIGLILFAVGTDQQWSWVPTYIGLGLVGFGFGASGDVSMSYLMDAYPEMVIEMMTGVSVINNMIGCIFTFACSPWLSAMGNTNTFIILAVIEFLIMMSAAPFIYYGKRIRIWTKSWYLDFCQLRDGKLPLQ